MFSGNLVNKEHFIYCTWFTFLSFTLLFPSMPIQKGKLSYQPQLILQSYTAPVSLFYPPSISTKLRTMVKDSSKPEMVWETCWMKGRSPPLTKKPSFHEEAALPKSPTGEVLLVLWKAHQARSCELYSLQGIYNVRDTLMYFHTKNYV